MRERHIVVGLGFGDEGKGSIVDYLVRDRGAQAVVRFSGGAQCGHRVVTPDGRSHVFSQFGAGTFVPGVETYLSRHVLVNPLNLFREEEHLAELGVTDALERLHVDVYAVLVTPFHVAANRIQELARGADAHGTCGEGIGDARSDELYRTASVIRAIDVFFEEKLIEKLREIQQAKRTLAEHVIGGVNPAEHSAEHHWRLVDEVKPLLDPKAPELLAAAYADLRPHVVPGWWLPLRDYDRIVFEGAQGILLDEKHGYLPPHVTWTDTTSAKAHRLLDEAGYDGYRRTLGVTRSYMTRHGAGPFPTESPQLAERLQDAENGDDGWQGRFRVGTLDTGLLRRSLVADGLIDHLAVTCLDRYDVSLDDVQDALNVPVMMVSVGPKPGDKYSYL